MTSVESLAAPKSTGNTYLGWRKSDIVYHAIRKSILLGERPPGDPLLEQKIGAEFGCSQGTVREALLRLEQDGLVHRRGYQGTVVSQTSDEEAEQMTAIRIALECAGIRKSRGVLTKELMNELTEITRAMDRATARGDYYTCSELDREFHVTLFRAAGMPGLEPILMRCVLHTHRQFYNKIESMWRDFELGAWHRGFLQILADGDMDTAENAVRTHIRKCLPEP